MNLNLVKVVVQPIMILVKMANVEKERVNVHPVNVVVNTVIVVPQIDIVNLVAKNLLVNAIKKKKFKYINQ